MPPPPRRELVPTDRLKCVRTFASLFDTFATPENGVDPANPEECVAVLEMWFQFCLMWGVGGPLDEDGRRKFDAFMREQNPTFPTADTVFEYWVDFKNKVWAPWEIKLPSNFKPASYKVRDAALQLTLQSKWLLAFASPLTPRTHVHVVYGHCY